jgi:hypothetical protein
LTHHAYDLAVPGSIELFVRGLQQCVVGKHFAWRIDPLAAYDALLINQEIRAARHRLFSLADSL